MVTRLARDLAILKKSAVAGIFKKAQPETKSDANYESALSSIAHAYIQDRAPELLKHELGFQLVEKSDDDRRAVGIFGFKIGKIIVYVPVFYIDGKVYGTDMMLIFNSRKVVPLDEDWVRYVYKLQANVVGEPVDALAIASSLAYPNLMQLKPNTLKWAMYQPRWLQPFIPEYVAAKFNPRIKIKTSSMDLLRKSASARAFLARFLEAYPRWIKTFHDVYGAEFDNLLRKSAGETLPQHPDFWPKEPRKFEIADLDRAAKPSDVEFYVYIHEKAPHRLSPSDLQKLREQGYLIIDRRRHHAVIRRRPNRQFEGVVQPGRAGFYHLLLRDLSVICAYVVPIKHLAISWDSARSSRVQREPEMMLVVPIYRADESRNILKRYSGREGFVVSRKALVVASKPQDDEEHDFDILQNAREFTPRRTRKNDNDLPVGLDSMPERAVFFTRDEATEPVRVHRVQGDSHRGHIVFSVGENDAVVVDSNERRLRLVLTFHDSETKRNSRRLSHAWYLAEPQRATYYLPHDAKVVSIVDDGEVGQLKNQLMAIDDVLNAMVKHSSYAMRVWRDNFGKYVINGRHFDKYGALKALVVGCGLSEPDALGVLKEADAGEAEYLIKEAQPDMLQPGQPQPISAPIMSTIPPVGMLGSRPVVGPMDGYITVDTGIKGDVPNPVEPLQPTPQVDRLFQQALQTGRKEVFDTAVFSTMLRAAGEKDVIDQYIPRLIDALDAIGRIRVNSYVHRRAFEERFGKDDMEELDQLLKSVFHGLGEIIMELRQKQLAGPDREHSVDQILRGDY